MSVPASHNKEPDVELVEKKVPLSGFKLDTAVKAMESVGFQDRLTVRIMKLAEAMGLYNPFDEDDTNLPGGISAADLAVDIVIKALDGTYTWDNIRQPDFYRFCCSRALSILSNWLEKNKRMTTMSPLIEEDETGGEVFNAVNSAPDRADIYEVLRFRDGGALGDRLLQDFALSLPDNSHEQSILMAIYDDRGCVCREYCRGKLSLSERDYDAAMKRIRRAGPGFFKEWCRQNNVRNEDRKEAR